MVRGLQPQIRFAENLVRYLRKQSFDWPFAKGFGCLLQITAYWTKNMISTIPLTSKLWNISPFSFVQSEVAFQTELHPVLKHKFPEYHVQYLKFAKSYLPVLVAA